MTRASLFVFIAFPLLAACQGRESSRQVVQEPVTPRPEAIVHPLAFLLDSLSMDPALIRFHVDKSDRTFTVFGGERVLKVYPCVLGEKPVGDKFHQGDRKTPEGTFSFRSKRVHPEWHKFV